MALVALVIVIAGGARAANPGPDGAITACYATDTGFLRVVDAGAPCRAGEAPLSWRQRGSVGPAGPSGPPGRPGADSNEPRQPSGPAFRPGRQMPPGFTAHTRPLAAVKAKGLKELVAAGEPTEAFWGAKDQTVNLPGGNSFATVGTLNVPAGRYEVIAKAMFPPVPGDVSNSAYCRLQAGADFDDQLVLQASLFATVTARFKKPGKVELRCFAVPVGWPADQFHPNGEIPAVANVAWVKVTAINLARLANKPTGPPF